jgi:RimJ/RimL family protein N-acetyltransferase
MGKPILFMLTPLTEQNNLRPSEEKDLATVLKMERDPDNARFIRHWTLEQHQSAIFDAHYGHFIVEGPGAEILGYVILTGLDSPDQNIEFKRIVIRDKGRGLGRKTVSLILKKAFEELSAHRLWLDVLLENERAFHVYKSLGFKEDGIQREALKRGNEFLSLRLMSMLSHEYFHPAGRSL